MSIAIPLSVVDATWPAAGLHRVGPFVVREGKGGGKRVSAVTLDDARWSDEDIAGVEAKQSDLGQPALFMVGDGQEGLDASLAHKGYAVVDPVDIWSAPIANIRGEVPFLGAFAIWPPLEVMRDIWIEDGIGPARVEVMQRVQGPKTAVLGRVGDRPAGAAFVAVAGETAMLHALTVLEGHRRQGCAVNMLREAAAWAQDAGATVFSLVVTRKNAPAAALYASLGMEIVGHYHYRQKMPERG